MGCVKSKHRAPHEPSVSPKEKTSIHSGTTRASIRRPSASAKVETTDPAFVIEKDRPKVRSKQNEAQLKVDDAAGGRSRVDRTHGEPHPWAGTVPKGLEGEQVAAGWPSWLSQVAGEAIKGWIPRHAASFEKLDKVSGLRLELVMGVAMHFNVLMTVSRVFRRWPLDAVNLVNGRWRGTRGLGCCKF